MLSKIIIYLGGSFVTQCLAQFFRQNASILDSNNVICAPPLQAVSLRTCLEYNLQQTSNYHYHDFLGLFFRPDDILKDDIPSGFIYLKNLTKKYTSVPDKQTLCFFWPDFFRTFSARAELVKGIPTFFHSVFPHVEVHFVLNISEQIEAIESDMQHITLHGLPQTIFFSSWPNSTYQYDTIYCLLKDSLASNDRIHPVIQSTADSAFGFMEKLADMVGIKKISDYDAASLRLSDFLPRDILDFISHINRARCLCFELTQDLINIDWIAETRIAEASAETSALLSPQEQDKIRSKHFVHNKRLADLLHCPSLFSEISKPTDGWAPYYGLTEKSIAAILNSVSLETQALMTKILNKIPQPYQWSELRIIHAQLLKLSLVNPIIINRPTPKITVLSLAYNHANVIENCINGVIAQEVNFPVEHVIADDGSTDGTRDIILDYASRYSHITPLLKFKNRNAREGYNIPRLFSMAKSPYVSMCDGDDYFIDPHKLQKQVDFLDANPRVSVCFHPVLMKWDDHSQQDMIFPMGNKLPQHKPPYTLTDLTRWNFISTSSVMYRWRFTDGVPSWFFYAAMPGDWYWHMLHAENGRIGMLPDIMSVYRQHNNGIWKHAELDFAQHKAHHGIKELNTYIAMDNHFKGRFRDILGNRILSEFLLLYVLGIQQNDFKLFETALSRHPEWADKALAVIQNAGISG